MAERLGEREQQCGHRDRAHQHRAEDYLEYPGQQLGFESGDFRSEIASHYGDFRPQLRP